MPAMDQHFFPVFPASLCSFPPPAHSLFQTRGTASWRRNAKQAPGPLGFLPSPFQHFLHMSFCGEQQQQNKHLQRLREASMLNPNRSFTGLLGNPRPVPYLLCMTIFRKTSFNAPRSDIFWSAWPMSHPSSVLMDHAGTSRQQFRTRLFIKSSSKRDVP